MRRREVHRASTIARSVLRHVEPTRRRRAGGAIDGEPPRRRRGRASSGTMPSAAAPRARSARRKRPSRTHAVAHARRAGSSIPGANAWRQRQPLRPRTAWHRHTHLRRQPRSDAGRTRPRAATNVLGHRTSRHAPDDRPSAGQAVASQPGPAAASARADAAARRTAPGPRAQLGITPRGLLEPERNRPPERGSWRPATRIMAHFASKPATPGPSLSFERLLELLRPRLLLLDHFGLGREEVRWLRSLRFTPSRSVSSFSASRARGARLLVEVHEASRAAGTLGALHDRRTPPPAVREQRETVRSRDAASGSSWPRSFSEQRVLLSCRARTTGTARPERSSTSTRRLRTAFTISCRNADLALGAFASEPRLQASGY